MKQLRYVLVVMGMWTATHVQAQANLALQSDGSNLYLNHTVAPKENFYSIGRLYNISPKDIAPFNNLQMANGLSIGQSVKIPLKAQNFTQNGQKAAGEVLVPVYHVINGKETLYHISQVSGKVNVASIKQWNKLTSDAVPASGKLIVGYLRVQKAQSALASGAANVAVSAPAVAANTPDKTTDEPATAVPTPVKETPAKEAPVKDAPVKETPAKTPPANDNPTPAKTTPVVPVVETPAATPATTAPATTASTGGARYAGDGVFKSEYMSQTTNGKKTQSSTGLTGVFKSTSGWDNGKFYALMNGVDRGTIVKITNLSNNKVVYAKVLGDIADMQQNTGTVIVISDAAAGQLGATTDKFSTSISYAK